MAKAHGAKADKSDDDEIRVITDHPAIDGIEDMDGDVREFNVGIDNLDDLSRGDVLRHTVEGESESWYAVTGRHEASRGTSDTTDVIEMRAINSYSGALLSRPGSVAFLHARAAFGEIEIRTGVRAFVTRLAGRVRQHRDAIRFRRGVER